MVICSAGTPYYSAKNSFYRNVHKIESHCVKIELRFQYKKGLWFTFAKNLNTI